VPQSIGMQIVLLGVNHRSAGVELRERVAFSPAQACAAALELRRRGLAEEAVILSTCNRSEIYGVSAERPSEAAPAIERFWAAFHGVPAGEFAAPLYRRSNSEAAEHLFRVAAGLDSMLLGEAEILGQVREAYRAAFEAQSTGPVLNRLFQSALEAGKRVRAETELGTRPMSVAFAAVRLAEKIFGKLRGHSALILGAGTMGEQLVEHLRDRGLGRILVANRTARRGEELARRFGGAAVSWAELETALTQPDVVVASVGAEERVLTRALVERVMAARHNRPLFLIDLGVPRNVETSAAELYNVYLFGLDDLAGIVEQNRRAREHEIPRAEAIVGEQVARFEAWHASAMVARLIGKLREKLQHERDAFLSEYLDTLPHLSDAERGRVVMLTQSILNEVLSEPAARAQDAQELRRRLQNLEAVRELFGLARERT
jgi:glutamyl-tRNA reductase